MVLQCLPNWAISSGAVQASDYIRSRRHSSDLGDTVAHARSGHPYLPRAVPLTKVIRQTHFENKDIPGFPRLQNRTQTPPNHLDPLPKIPKQNPWQVRTGLRCLIQRRPSCRYAIHHWPSFRQEAAGRSPMISSLGCSCVVENCWRLSCVDL